MKQRVWINFKELRARLKFEDVLTHFKVEVKRKGEQHQGFCLLPGHDGKSNSPSFSANLERGIFHCFGCGAKGNVLEFAALMRGVDPKDGDALRTVALELQMKFLPEGASRAHPAREAAKPIASTPQATPALINPPLDFSLQGLDPGHEYLLGRGFSRATLAHFGVGFCSRGLLKDRVAIPLHDSTGNLVGYAGRVVDDAAINEENPRYRFPSGRERKGAKIEFRKSLLVYNGHRLTVPVDNLVVVEGFPSVWWLHQYGCPPAVALMGSECSDEQAELIVAAVKPAGRLWLMPDGDRAGERLAQQLFALLSPRRFVRWYKLGERRQPTDVPSLTLKTDFTL